MARHKAKKEEVVVEETPVVLDLGQDKARLLDLYKTLKDLNCSDLGQLERLIAAAE